MRAWAREDSCNPLFRRTGNVNQCTVVATTGGAVSATYCGWGGSVMGNGSRCHSYKYNPRKDLREIGVENFKTGAIVRSATSPCLQAVTQQLLG